MTDVGSDVYQKLLTGTAGLPVYVTYKFNGLTPPAGFKVTANWDLAYEHYSKNSQFRARASYYGLFSANYAEERTYIRDELVKSGAIKIEAIEGGKFTQETLDSYLQPIVKRINDQLLEDQKPPPKIDPAKAASPATGGRFGGVGYSVAMKDVRYVKKGSEVWDFRIQSIVERGGRADGLVGLARYSQSTRDRLVQNVDAGNWERIYYSLPPVPKAIDSAELRLRLKENNSQIAEKYFRWTATQGWINAEGNTPASGVWVSLLAHPNMNRAVSSWNSRYQFVAGDEVVAAELTTPLEGEGGQIQAPKDLVRLIRVTPDSVFERAAAEPRVVSVDVRLTDGDRIGQKAFRKAADGTVTPDYLWPALRIANGKPVEISADMVFNFDSGKSCSKHFSPDEFKNGFQADEIVLAFVKQTSCAQ